MARSVYIYLVYDQLSVVGAFTVKHEMETWIQNQKFNEKPRILRYKDGSRQKYWDCIELEYRGTWNDWSGH